MLRAWVPNSLPVPHPLIVEAAISSAEASTQEVEQKNIPQIQPQQVEPPKALNFEILQNILEISDNFPKAVVVKYFPHQGLGTIKDVNGREVQFNLAELDFIGEKGKDMLQLGANVGFDVSHASNGLHVKKLKIY